MNDTICAISTPPGMGGIGIVRLSGPEAVGIAGRIFACKDPKVGNNYRSHRIYYGHVVNPDDGSAVDEALLTVMLAPRTYTREDVAEINCHGGPAAVRKVLELAVAAGARLAGPGEFTRRAFLNGRIDLTQAEAVMDVISSGTELALRAAVGQLGGGLGRRIEAVREGLAELLALTEVSIDFPEEEIEYVPAAGLTERGVAVRETLRALIDTHESGRILREGLKLAIVGSPNVGKSSLLNLLAKRERAIVTEIPGTTRDTVEETVNLGGIPVRLIDTAGIRESSDIVEREGVRRSVEAMERADIVLLVLDGSRALNAEDEGIIQKIENQRQSPSFLLEKRKEAKENQLSKSNGAQMLIVINKCDLPQHLNIKDIPEGLKQRTKLSAKTGEGLEDLIAKIKNKALSGGIEKAPEAAINLRHKEALERADAAVGRFLDGCAQKLSQEFLALELRDALGAVGEIVGETTPDDILNKIFGDFCIGK